MRDLALIGSVVIHCPDFFVPAAAAHEENLALGNPRNAAAKPEDNFVGEFVRDDSGFIAGGRILILLAQYLRRRDVLHVIKPALHGYVVSGNAQVTEREHRRIYRRSVPAIELYFRRIAG